VPRLEVSGQVRMAVGTGIERCLPNEVWLLLIGFFSVRG